MSSQFIGKARLPITEIGNYEISSLAFVTAQINLLQFSFYLEKDALKDFTLVTEVTSRASQYTDASRVS